MTSLHGKFKTRASGRLGTALFTVTPSQKPITSKRRFVAKLTTAKGARLGRTYGPTAVSALKRLKERFQV